VRNVPKKETAKTKRGDSLIKGNELRVKGDGLKQLLIFSCFTEKDERGFREKCVALFVHSVGR